MSAITPIVLIEDDKDDAGIFEMVVTNFGNTKPIKVFSNAESVLEYLSATEDQPFLIICNLRMAQTDMIYLKKTIDAQPQLKRKSIPFIYYFTEARPETVEDLYTQMNIQGVFRKTGDLNELKRMFKTILDYWEICVHPKRYQA